MTILIASVGASSEIAMWVWEVGMTSRWRIERGDAPGTIVVEDPIQPASAWSSTAQAAS